MKTPMVSVVIPAFRQAAFIEGALDSVATQTYRGSIETIVVDDGCPENSAELAERHALKPRVVRQQNAGAAGARNRGIREARGELIAFLDADDRWHASKLEQQVQHMAGIGGPSLCFTRNRRITPDGALVQPAEHPSLTLKPSLRTLLRQNFVGCSTTVVHRLCFDEAGAFPDSPELRRGGQDYALWLRIALDHPLVYVPDVLVDYLVHPTNRVGVDAVKNFEGAVHALRSLEDFSPGAIQRATGQPPRAAIARRGSDMLADLWHERARPSAWRRAVRALFHALK